MIPASAEAIVAATAPPEPVECEVDDHVPALVAGVWLPRPAATVVKQVRLRKKRRKLEMHEKRTKGAARRRHRTYQVQAELLHDHCSLNLNLQSISKT